MTAIDLANNLNQMILTGQIDDTTKVIFGTQSQALDVDSIRIHDKAIRDEDGKAKQIVRRVLLS